jgi:thiol-disulfide isomerase/thioredoxin
MKPNSSPFDRWPHVLSGVLSATVCLLISPMHASGQDVAASPKIDARADEVIKAASGFYGSLKSFSVEMGMRMKMQMQGMKTEMTTDYALAMQRPNLLSLTAKSGGFGAMMAGNVVCDGSKLYTSMPMLQKYTASEAPANLDSALDAGGFPMMQASPGLAFVGSLLKHEPYEELMEGVTAGTYTGLEKLGDVECHRLRFVQEQFDWDIWVATGEEPRVMKVVPDMAKTFAMVAEIEDAPEQLKGMKDMKMDFELTFNNWAINPSLGNDRFKFTPPEGAKLVESFFEGLGIGEKDHALLGKPAPALNLDLLGGGRLDLAAHKGKEVVVLDFWATWCGPCVKGLPILTEVTAAYKDRGVVFYAVNEQEEKATIEAFLKKQKLALTVALDQDGRAGEAYGVEGIPQTVLIGKDGTVEAVHVGLLPNLKSKLRQELDVLLAGKKLVNDDKVEATKLPPLR